MKGALGIGLVAGLGAPPAARAATAEEIARMRPQEGDQLVFSGGARDGETIAAADLVLGAQPTLAFPREPESGVLRNGSRLNRVSLIRVDPARFDDRTRPDTVDGIIAFSAVCTHGGCLVSMWREVDQALFCPCHYSRFDPWKGGKVVGGPAKRRLPRLPLRLADGELRLAGGFSNRVGNR